jgi:hypothetical protein
MQKSLPVAEKLKKHPFVPLLVHSIGKEAFFVKKHGNETPSKIRENKVY